MGLINYSNESNASPYIAKEESRWIPLFIWCAGHGTNSVGDSPTTDSYRQV